VLLLVNPDILPELNKQFTTTLPVSNLIKGAALDPELSALIDCISETYFGNSSYKDAITRGYLLAFFGKLLQKTELKDVQSCDYHILGMILNYCITNSDKNLTLGLLESELHISKYYISHVINEKLGEGFNEYINSIRINEACKLLVKSDKSIKEISAEVGFGTVRSFDRAFKAKNGETAREYRRRNA
jgi:YesN/AraC family two-component response regulator